MSGWMLNNWVIKWQMKINVNKYRGIHRGRSKSNYPYAMTSCKIAHRKKKKKVEFLCKFSARISLGLCSGQERG